MGLISLNTHSPGALSSLLTIVILQLSLETVIKRAESKGTALVWTITVPIACMRTLPKLGTLVVMAASALAFVIVITIVVHSLFSQIAEVTSLAKAKAAAHS